MARKEFPKAVKVARLKYATRDGAVYCEGCGVQIKPGMFAFDHHDPDGLTGEPTFDNCRVLCVGEGSCHGQKTKLDVAQISYAKKLEASHLSVKKSSRAKIAQRPKTRLVSDKIGIPPRRDQRECPRFGKP